MIKLTTKQNMEEEQYNVTQPCAELWAWIFTPIKMFRYKVLKQEVINICFV